MTILPVEDCHDCRVTAFTHPAILALEERYSLGISFRQLEYFDAVAETGSVTAAASKLFVSQSAISSAIGELESSLNVSLFIRHPRGLSLSADGLVILRHAKAALGVVSEIQNVARHLGQGISGSIRLGCYSTIAPRLVPPLVELLESKYPELRLSFETGDRSKLIDGLRRGNFDVIVIYDYSFEQGLNEVGTITQLTAVKPYALLPSEHPLAGSPSVWLEQLVEDRFILFELKPAAQYFLSLFEKAKLKPKVWFRTGSNEVIRGMVARGLGYSLLTQYSEHSFSHDGNAYVQKQLSNDFEALPIVAVTLKGGEERAKVDVFLSLLKDLY